MALHTITGKLIQVHWDKGKVTLYYDELGLEERASIFIRPVDVGIELQYPITNVETGDFDYCDLYEKAHSITHMLEEETH